MSIKYYKLLKDLPTFEKGELFYMDDFGSIHRVKDDLLAYYHTTVDKFPNMVEDWFEEVPAPARDAKTKAAFEAYLTLHPEQRFFQAVRNFTRRYLNDAVTHVWASSPLDVSDTFNWECDEMLKEDDEVQS